MASVIINKAELVEIAEEAVERNYNRQIDVSAVRSLNESLYVLQILLLHEYVAGVKQPTSNLHFRCQVLKHDDKDGGGRMLGFVDVPLTWFTAVNPADYKEN